MLDIIGPIIIGVMVTLAIGWLAYHQYLNVRETPQERRLRGLRPPRRPYDGWGRW